MSITITLDDALAAELETRAKQHHLGVEQFAINILAKAVVESEPVTPSEALTRIQATAPRPSQTRPATANLADALRAAPGDPDFDLENWTRQWAVVEAEMKAVTRANDSAESRGE